MLTVDDIGKRVILFDNYHKKWEPTNEGWVLDNIDHSLENGYIAHEGKKSFVFPLKFIRVIDTP
jgi:hypothetical protein